MFRSNVLSASLFISCRLTPDWLLGGLQVTKALPFEVDPQPIVDGSKLSAWTGPVVVVDSGILFARDGLYRLSA